MIYGRFPAPHLALEPLPRVSVEHGVAGRRKAGVEITNARSRSSTRGRGKRDPELRRDHTGLNPGIGNLERGGIVVRYHPNRLRSVVIWGCEHAPILGHPR